MCELVYSMEKKEEIKDIIEAGCLEIELLFIDFEHRINKLYEKYD